jgi:hypothetical protein
MTLALATSLVAKVRCDAEAAAGEYASRYNILKPRGYGRMARVVSSSSRCLIWWCMGLDGRTVSIGRCWRMHADCYARAPQAARRACGRWVLARLCQRRIACVQSGIGYLAALG